MGEQHAAFREPLLERPNWFGGRLLTAADLDVQQCYVRERMRRRNRLLHGWGVVRGLDVAAGAGVDLVVSAGFALDAAGNEILVPEDTVFDAQLAGLRGPGQTHWLVIRWDECPIGELPAPRPNDPPVAAAWQEDFELAVVATPPAATARGGTGAATPWLVLATVVWDGRHDTIVDTSVRRQLQPPGDAPRIGQLPVEP